MSRRRGHVQIYFAGEDLTLPANYCCVGIVTDYNGRAIVSGEMDYAARIQEREIKFDCVIARDWDAKPNPAWVKQHVFGGRTFIVTWSGMRIYDL